MKVLNSTLIYFFVINIIVSILVYKISAFNGFILLFFMLNFTLSITLNFYYLISITNKLFKYENRHFKRNPKG